jgi:heme A synthase
VGLTTIKQGGAVLLAAINLALLLWALRGARRRLRLPDSFLGLLRLSAAVGAFQVLMGLLFLVLSYRARPMHYMYGSLVGLGALAQFLMARPSALGERMRNRGGVHAFLALLIALMAIRSWMSV